jgi:hypothetical protein
MPWGLALLNIPAGCPNRATQSRGACEKMEAAKPQGAAVAQNWRN